eukprot:721797-Prymnesium_polylepis.1
MTTVLVNALIWDQHASLAGIGALSVRRLGSNPKAARRQADPEDAHATLIRAASPDQGAKRASSHAAPRRKRRWLSDPFLWQ